MSYLYRKAGKVLHEVQSNKKSLKGVWYSGKNEEKNGCKKIFALVCETLRYMDALHEIVSDSGCESEILDDSMINDFDQFWVMMYDFLIGKGSINGGGKLKRHIVSFETALRNSLLNMKRARGGNANSPTSILLPQHRNLNLPRYARVNLIKVEVKSVLKVLNAEGIFGTVDNIVEDLLVFKPGTDLHSHPLVLEGKLILQDKSSCFPIKALFKDGVEWLHGGDVIDCCAAPGSKTTHISSYLASSDSSEKSRIFAFDRDHRRAKVLQERCVQSGAQNVDVICQDFLEVDPHHPSFRNVRAILVDPSCSGSGIVTAPDRINDDVSQDMRSSERIRKLAGFQVRILSKALSFPQAKRVVYSTCSLYDEENEKVVESALIKHNETAHHSEKWKLSSFLTNWKRRSSKPNGSSLTPQQLACMVKAIPEDRTNGFFVALFVRNDAQDEDARVDEKKRKRKKFEADEQLGCEDILAESRGAVMQKRKHIKFTDDPYEWMSDVPAIMKIVM